MGFELVKQLRIWRTRFQSRGSCSAQCPRRPRPGTIRHLQSRPCGPTDASCLNPMFESHPPLNTRDRVLSLVGISPPVAIIPAARFASQPGCSSPLSSPDNPLAHLRPLKNLGYDRRFPGGVEIPHTDAHRDGHDAPLDEYVGVRTAAGGLHDRF